MAGAGEVVAVELLDPGVFPAAELLHGEGGGACQDF